MRIQVNDHKVEIPEADEKRIADFSIDIMTPTPLGAARVEIRVTTAAVAEKEEE